jgi:predicted phosphodiesterase
VAWVVAVLADIHGNARALEAVLADIGGRGVETIVNLGDCLYGPFDPRRVAARLIGTGWPTVSGNEDRCLLDQKALAASATARFTRKRLAPRHLAWIEALPKTRRVGPALAFHGAPSDDATYLLSRSDGSGGLRPAVEDEIAPLLSGLFERLILCGHDHTPRTVRLSDGRTIANPGSVGCPAYTDDHPVSHAVETGTPHARYAIVRVGPDGIDVEHVAVLYDWAEAAREAEANGFPDWARWIATGRV